ncbi:MAG: hypothetical protein DRP45_07510, partial [Candidatus Zixiibacteriota bacterium]
MRRLILLFVLLLAFSTVQATTIHVPADQTTIQAGIDAAVTGDTVLVAAGGYPENIEFIIDVVLLSASGPDVTSVAGVASGQPVVRFSGGSGTVSGFTIQDGQLARGVSVESGCEATIYNCVVTGNDDGGIHCDGAGTTIRKCVIYSNGYPWSGAGVWVTANQVVIDSCVFHDCTSEAGGGAIHADQMDDLTVSKTIAYENSTGGHGGGFVYVYYSSNVTLLGNTIVSNTSEDRGAGITAWDAVALEVRNNIIAFNNVGYGVWISGSSGIVCEYNDVYGNEGGNYYGCTAGSGSISEDPTFVDAAAYDFTLLPGSPCIDAGDPAPAYNDPDGSRVDMGAIWSLADYPLVRDLNFGSDAVGDIVINPTPTIYWSYLDPGNPTQYQFEVEVGYDDDWSVAEMWDTAPTISTDTTVIYAGLPLENDGSYYLRVRVHNGTDWSEWKELAFQTHFATVIHVPGTFSTIQEAVDHAGTFDTVLVAAGDYSENVVVGETITLISESGPDVTFITGVTYAEPVIRFHSGANFSGTVSGFTIRDGQFSRGIYVMSGNAPAIYDCIVTGNGDGGIHCDGEGTVICKCVIHNNGYPWSGAGVWVTANQVVIDSCVFHDCTSEAGGGA